MPTRAAGSINRELLAGHNHKLPFDTEAVNPRLQLDPLFRAKEATLVQARNSSWVQRAADSTKFKLDHRGFRSEVATVCPHFV